MVKITFLVLCYNHENYIDRAIESIVSQKHQYNFEILISDDGSSDNTVGKINKWIEKYPQNIELFVQYRDTNTKYRIMDRINNSILFLLKRIRGDYFCLFDGDDYCINKYFVDHAVSVMERDEAIASCVFNFQYSFPDEIYPVILPGFSEGYIDPKTFISMVYIHSGSFMFRNFLNEQRIAALSSSQFIVDNVMVPFFLQFGKLFYINEISYSYTASGGLWTSLKKIEQDLFTCSLGKIVGNIVPQYKWFYYNRLLPYMQSLFQCKKNIRNELPPELFIEYDNIAKKNKDFFLRGILHWNDFNLFQRFGFTLFYRYMIIVTKTKLLDIKVFFFKGGKCMKKLVQGLAIFRKKLLKGIFGRHYINNIMKINEISNKLDTMNVASIVQEINSLKQSFEGFYLKYEYDRVIGRLDQRVLFNTSMAQKENVEVFITILMPIYNEEQALARALESILMQRTSYAYQILVIDDGSTDNSFEIIKKYRELYPDILSYEKNEKNIGLLRTLFKGYSRITTKYFTVLDGDDFWLCEDKIQKAISFLEANSDFTIYGSNTLVREKSLLRKMNNHPSVNFTFQDIPVFLQTSSAFFRNVFTKFEMEEIERTYFETPFAKCFEGDVFRDLFALNKGRGYYEDSVDSVYNITNLGNWTKLSEKDKMIENTKLFYIMNEYFLPKKSNYIIGILEYFSNSISKEIESYSENERMLINSILFKLNI
jgi:glycosyltransferase involved in cell wall biosynthesis